jgi:hypothetical protein
MGLDKKIPCVFELDFGPGIAYSVVEFNWTFDR